MKKILVINGHPDKNSFNFGLSNAYEEAARAEGHEVQEISIRDLDFKANLEFGYQERTELEPDLLEAWEKIKWAEHLVWIYPLWWGFMPANMKGFIDRLFLPGLAFQTHENSARWDKLLTGKTAHIITTMDYPAWYYKWVLGAPGTKVMKKMILGFVGIKTIRTTYISPIKGSNIAFRKNWIEKIKTMVL